MDKSFEKLINRKNLTEKEAEKLILAIHDGKFNSSQVASILTALKIKGETVEEITGFISAMRKTMVHVEGSSTALDIVGTGGDGKGTFNISTAAGLVVAGAGVNIAKHGNRAASGKCGSADVLESLGVNINLTPERAEKVLKKVGMVFLFAPLYHPVMKILGPVRRELGFRTVFNFLGPFLNPADTKYQLMGVPSLEIAKKLSKVAAKLSYKKLLIVVSEEGIDEISLGGKTYAFEISGSKVKSKIINPNKLGFAKRKISHIRGGDSEINKKIILDILDGSAGPKRDIVILNSAFAFYVSGKAKTVENGIELAQESIDSGKAKMILNKLISETQKYA